MLDFLTKHHRTAITTYFGQALAFKMNNGTDYDSASVGNNRVVPNDSISGCLDSRRQSIVPVGEYYYSDSCTLCLCSNTEIICKQISCAPPERCDGYIKRDPAHCCDLCVPDVVIERSSEHSNLNLKLGALTVALFLVLSLILFTLHRMRRKRLLITLRRLQSFRHRDSICSHVDESMHYRSSIDVAGTGLFLTPTPAILAASNRAAIIAEGPPPYNAAVTLPRPPEPLARAPPRSTANMEPPPPYRQAIQDASNVRRSASQNGRHSFPVGVGGLGRQSRTSDYPDDDDENFDVRSTSSCSSTSSSASSASSLSTSRDSLHVPDNDNSSVDADCCSCSHCDSGLSEERGSFSSNEIRPRVEMRSTVSSTQVTFGQATSAQTSSATASHEGCQNGQARIQGNGCADGGRQRANKGKLCKRKLKKLMMKAKRKARSMRQTEQGASNGGNRRGNVDPSVAAVEHGDCGGRLPTNRRSPDFRESGAAHSNVGVAETVSVTSV